MEWKQVKANKGAAGMDGLYIGQTDQLRRSRLEVGRLRANTVQIDSY
jgi:hypothetical protein